MDTRRIATVTGWLWIVTFVTSIPARFIFYAPVRDEPNYVTGAGDAAWALVATGAVLELFLIISNVGTAVVPYSIHKRVNEAGAVGYVTARVMECVFIAIGIVAMLAILTVRQDAPSGTDAALGQGLEAVYEWAFRIGPGFFVGVGNGLILGYLMYTSALVPRGMAMLGLIGGPLLCLAGILVIYDVIEAERSRPGPHDDPGGPLGVVAGYLPRREGVQAVADPRGASPGDPGTQRGRRLVRAS